MKRKRPFGPGLLVAAAFIGPGTVTTASVAGAQFGFALVWAVGFSVLATLVLQEMAARLGIIARSGLGEALRTAIQTPLLRLLLPPLVVIGIGGGNAAFEMGNILGAALALAEVSGLPTSAWTLVIGGLAFGLLWSGTYAAIERVLVLLVLLMSGVFLLTALLVQPSLSDILAGFSPTLPAGSLVTVLALVGTTVVPYNLFLHASTVQAKWPATLPASQALREARADTFLSISLGGVLTLALVATAAAAFFRHGIALENAASLAKQLEPLVGSHARLLFATGLFAAGLTSAITAPLAAAYATAGVLGWSVDSDTGKVRLVWGAVILIGTGLAFFGRQPLLAILLAQAVNACLLPLLAGCLLFVMNKHKLLGSYTNGALANVAGGAVVLIVTGLGVFQFFRVWGVIPT